MLDQDTDQHGRRLWATHRAAGWEIDRTTAAGRECIILESGPGPEDIAIVPAGRVRPYTRAGLAEDISGAALAALGDAAGRAVWAGLPDLAAALDRAAALVREARNTPPAAPPVPTVEQDTPAPADAAPAGDTPEDAPEVGQPQPPALVGRVRRRKRGGAHPTARPAHPTPPAVEQGQPPRLLI